MNKKIDKKDIEKIFIILEQQNPNPECELYFTNNFELVIAVLLSAQATDISVNNITPKLFSIAKTPEKMLKLGEEKIKDLIKSIGLYKSKAKNIISTCEILIKNYNSSIPTTRDELETLPGVGRKTANVVLNVAFKENTIAVDTHVKRVSQRLGLTTHTIEKKIEQELMHLVPNKYIYHAHLWLILHGRYICKARKPLCNKCSINKYCRYDKKEL
jgi:endonuclease-3